MLYADGDDATSLNANHWVLASIASICAVRHSQRMADAPQRQATALLMALVVSFTVVAGFRREIELSQKLFG